MSDPEHPSHSTPEPGPPPEYRDGPQVRTGFILGQTFDAKQVRYTLVDGQAMFEGDIQLGTEEEMQRVRELVEGHDAAVADIVADEPAEVLPESIGIPGQQFRWPDGVVAWELDPALPAAQVSAATNAVAHWLASSRLQLVQRTAANAAQFPDVIRFVPGGGCSSPVGRRGGVQNITLAGGCFFGQAVHEIGHSAGLWHEQSREDRNSFITINVANIAPAAVHNFDQQITDGDDIGPYDYGSIMHYGPTAFSVNLQPTIVPAQPLPAGVTLGQRDGLSEGDRAGIRALYPNLEPSHANTWVGDFTGDGRQDVLFYLRSRMQWYLGSWDGGKLIWVMVGDTSGFGQVGDGRPFWVGDFDGDGAAELLFHFPGDGNWWLGGMAGGELIWDLVSNTLGGVPGDPNFGQVSDGRPIWTGSFSAPGRTEVLFYFPGDDNWWLGSWNGTRFGWSFAGSTAGFGHGINDGRPFWIGDFDGDGLDDVLFYVPGDGNWWLGSYGAGQQLHWRLIGNTLGATRPAPPLPQVCQPVRHQAEALRSEITGLQAELSHAAPPEKAGLVRQIKVLRQQLATAQRQLTDCVASNSAPAPVPWPNFGQLADGRPFHVGRFSRPDRAQLMFYFPGDGNWWLASLDGPELSWTHAGNTSGFGQVADGRPFFIGDYTADGRDDVLFYVPGDDNWWLASLLNGQLQWSPAGNTAGFGHGINNGRPFWSGRFSQAGRSQILFYVPGDGNCWLGSHDGSTLAWSLEATFES